MHALSLYILIGLQEGEIEHKNIDFLLLSAVIVISSPFLCFIPTKKNRKT